MFQIHGSYTPLDVLIIARRSDPHAHFVPARDGYAPPQSEEDFLNSGNTTLISYNGQEVKVTGAWRAGTYMAVSGAPELEAVLQHALGGVLAHDLERCVPLTAYPSSEERMAGLSALRDEPVSVAYAKSGCAPRYDALKRMTLTAAQEPRVPAISGLAPDVIDLAQDVEKRLMTAGFDLLGERAGDAALWRVSRKDDGKHVYVSVNNPAHDYIISDAVQRRPELFDGLGTIAVFFDDPERKAPSLEESEETRSLRLLLSVADALPEYRTLDLLIPKLLSFDNGDSVSEETPFGSDYLLTRSASPMMASSAYAQDHKPRGVLVAPRHALDSLSALRDDGNGSKTPCKLSQDSAALAHALAAALSKPVVVVPDLSGLSERNVVVVNPGKSDAAYLNVGGAFATKEDRATLKSLKRPASVREEYAPISLSGDKQTCEQAREALRETLLCVDLAVFAQTMQQAIRRGKSMEPER